jgi:hypothetical protein
MVGVPRAAASGMRGVDALTLLTREQLIGLTLDEGVKWVGTYLGTCTLAYRDLCFDLGLGLALIGRALTGPVTSEMGHRHGADLVLSARSLDAPAGIHVTIDCEDQTADVVGFVDSCADELLDAGGFRSMLYMGMPCALTPEAAQLTRPDRYWRCGSIGIDPHQPARKWSCIQLRPLDALYMGARIDRNVIEQDAHGETPVLWWPQ